jgi:hypothetical protein
METYLFGAAIGFSFFLLFGARRLPRHVINFGKRIAERRKSREQLEF